MSEQARAIASSIVLFLCLAALLGAVALKVEGAGVALIAIVTTVVAFFTRAPEKKDPPGSTLIPLVAAAGLATALLSGCAMFQTPEAKAREAEAAYAAQMLRCVDDEPKPKPGASAHDRNLALSRVDRCRELVRERWTNVETATVADAGGDQ